MTRPSVGRDVADVRHPVERHQVVLAGASTPRCRARGPARRGRSSKVVDEHVGGVLPQPGEDSRVGPGDPRRGVAQALAVGVLADRDEELADRGLGAREVDRARASTASPLGLVRVGVDTATLGHLDDLGRRVLLRVRVGPGLGRRVDRGRCRVARVTVGARGARRPLRPFSAACSAGVSTGGWSDSVRRSLESQVGRTGRLTTVAKIAASSAWR